MAAAHRDRWEAAKAIAALFRPVDEPAHFDVLTGAYLVATAIVPGEE